MHPQASADFNTSCLQALKGEEDKITAGLDKEPKQRSSAEESRGSFILCRYCKNMITDNNDIIEVAGSHRHSFVNPHGIIFKIGCFRLAPGCIGRGRPTVDFSWFAGYSWCLAFCLQCGAHLGWQYRAKDGDGFYGLVLNSLIEEG